MDKKSYDALYNWIDKTKRAQAKKILLVDGLDDVVKRLETQTNMGVWYAITQEAADAVGDKIVEQSANEAEIELNKAAAALGRKGGLAKSDRKAKSSAENGKRGGRPLVGSPYSIENKISAEGWDDELEIFCENSSSFRTKKEAMAALRRAKSAARQLGFAKEYIAGLYIASTDLT